MTGGAVPDGIAVNLLWIAPGRVGGSEQYLERQLRGVAQAGVATRIHCSRAFADAHADLGELHELVVAPGSRDRRAGRIVAEHTWLAARTAGAGLVHHGGGTTPLVGRRPIVLTVHDLQYRSFPQYFSPGRRTYLAAMMPRSVRRAAVVTVPSEFVRSTVVDAFDLDPERVVVVPHGIPAGVRSTASDIDGARSRFGLGDRPYLVYPAITHPHKGHRLLVDMLDHLDGHLDGHVDGQLDLVLVGGAGSDERALAATIGASRHRRRIHRTGRVSDRDRDALLAGAAALVFPSEYEGFGAPLVEAMAARVPIVCSDAAAVAEVVADAGIVVADRTGEAWALGVRDALRARDDLVVRGERRCTDFTLLRSGQALASAYDAALEWGQR